MKHSAASAALVCVAVTCCWGCGRNPLEATVERLESQLKMANEQLALAHGQLEAATALREAAAKTYGDKLAAERHTAKQLEQAIADGKAEAVAHAEVASQRATQLASVVRQVDHLKSQIEELRTIKTREEQEPSPEGVWVYRSRYQPEQVCRIVFNKASDGTGRVEQWFVKEWRNPKPETSNLFRYTIKPDGDVEIMTAQRKQLFLSLRTANEGELSDPNVSHNKKNPIWAECVRVQDAWVPQSVELPNPEPALPIRKSDSSR